MTTTVYAIAMTKLIEAMLSTWHDPIYEDIAQVRREARAVLAVLPDLLTQRDVAIAVAAEINRCDPEIPLPFAGQLASAALIAAAKAVADDTLIATVNAL